LKSLAETISRQLRGWAQDLQDSPSLASAISRLRRRADQSRRDRDEFMKELDAMRKNT